MSASWREGGRRGGTSGGAPRGRGSGQLNGQLTSLAASLIGRARGEGSGRVFFFLLLSVECRGMEHPWCKVFKLREREIERLLLSLHEYQCLS